MRINISPGTKKTCQLNPCLLKTSASPSVLFCLPLCFPVHQIYIALNRNLIVESLLLLVALIWAFNFTVVKVTLDQVDPMSFNAMRFTIATIFMVIVLLRRGQKLIIHKGDLKKIVLLGLLGNLAYQCLFIFGINFTFAANAAVMLGTIPVWIALLGHFFFGEKLNRYKTAGVIFAFIGIILIMEGSEKGITLASETIIGDLIILSSAFVFGLYTLYTKQMLSRYTPIQYTTLMMLTGGVALIIAGMPWLITLDWGGVTPMGWSGVFYSGFLSIGAAYMVWNYGIRQVGTIRTAAYQNLVPVFGLLFGIILLNEHLFTLQYAGAASVITGIILSRK